MHTSLPVALLGLTGLALATPIENQPKDGKKDEKSTNRWVSCPLTDPLSMHSCKLSVAPQNNLYTNLSDTLPIMECNSYHTPFDGKEETVWKFCNGMFYGS
jgi:hypothetical protein